MRVVGIDPGLANCGFGVVEARNRTAEAADFGCWHTQAKLPIERRLGELFTSVTDLLLKHQPDAVALEESFVGRDPRGALAVGQVRGAIVVACAIAGFPCVQYPPASVKQAVCGYGRAEKAQVQQMAKVLLRLETTPTPTHAADALAVALCHALAPPLLQLAG
jgi:crossover junction endodeoxyribonuclease RuvC